ncbi:MAG TPA: GNAT family N-acetyltransferase [Firmicutes bacterium]|nr:GNAT family N-acetyltransferase [Candidatus Fermentithermobacillaceae bacterium]
MISTRAAKLEEYQTLFHLFKAAFKQDEAELFDYLIRNDPTLTPENIRVATHNDRPVACSIALPRHIRTARGNWVPGVIITLVACHPDYQGKGFGSAAVTDSLRYAADCGANLAMLYGHPAFYPRFGFVPVLPTVITTLDLADMQQAASECSTGVTGSSPQPACEGSTHGSFLVRGAQAADVAALLRLYEVQLANCPCCVKRYEATWIWKPRGVIPGRRVLVFCNTDSILGYAFIVDDPEQNRMSLLEVAVADSGMARAVLLEIVSIASSLGRRFVTTHMQPDTSLVRAALEMGASQEYRPAAAGMVCVLRWAGLLPGGYTVVPDTIAPPGPSDVFRLAYEGRIIFTATREALTKLVFGYEDTDRLLEQGALQWVDRSQMEHSQLDLLRKDFRRSIPKWYLAPYWY